MPLMARFAKNVRFVASCSGHYLPARVLRNSLGNRYPDFANGEYAVCIEGFQRSGNTFFVALFRFWNRSVRIAHHTHLASTVKAAVRRKIPTAVLIRPPDEAVASLVTWDTNLSVTTALLSYILFHRSLWRYGNGFVVLNFDEVTRSPDHCIGRLNRRFDSAFEFSPVTQAIRAKVHREIEKNDEKLARDELSSSLPKPSKAHSKQQLEPIIRANPLFSVADKWYRKYQRLARC